MAKLAMLFLAFVYLDFSIWYSAEMHNIWNEKKRKYRGILFRFWDLVGR